MIAVDNTEDFFKLLLDSEKEAIENLQSAFLRHTEHLAYMNKRISVLHGKNVRSNRLGDEKSAILYVSIRKLRPQHVIETGVGAGFSSGCILLALQDNGGGRLDSIDWSNYQSPFRKIRRDLKYNGLFSFFTLQEVRHIGSYFLKTNFHIPEGKESGWIIPENLKSNWQLHVGLSEKILPSLLARLHTIDIFFHDSEHSTRNMLFEFRAVWPHLKDKGIILSDNVASNDAFKIFSEEVDARKVIVFKEDFGAIMK